MAGVASCSSSSPSEKYDVFLSFRGEDTRRNFVSHLYSALLRNQIKTYKDDKTLEKGDEVWKSLVDAINNSYICIVVFSKDYASSTWCLKELTQILDCKQEGEIIPVFYEIDPSDVRKQTGSYKDAIQKHENDAKLDQETVSKWKASLEKAANFSGWDSQSKDYGDESNFIDEIVKNILGKLSCKYPSSELKGLIGIEENIIYIESLLQKVQTIGIWGMGGIGKTTIAKAVFDKLSRQYEGCCFLANVREESEKHGLNCLHNDLLSQLVKRKDIGKKGTSFRMCRLKRKKVLIVLDDVDASEQLEQLIGDYECLRSDSRLIVTTRDKQVLISRGVERIFQVPTLKFEESIKLFCMSAFKENHLKIEFEELTRKAVEYAGGIPLALKVLGSSLCFKKREIWESILKKRETHPDKKIQNVLKLSYYGLDNKEKKIFLDIACFFKGEYKDHVISILDACDFFTAAGIETLLDRALITIHFSGRIEMHDLIQEMGKEIVREESNNEPGRHSRLWDSKDLHDVLQHNKESHLIEGIILDMSKTRDLCLNADTFTKMMNLRFLKFYTPWGERSCKVYIPSNLELIFHKLRYFQWDSCPLRSLSSTCFEKLVELHMPNSNVEKLWDGIQDIVNLRIIDLSESKKLKELPAFCNSSNLEMIILKGCENLHRVDLSISHLPKLVCLALSCCLKLESLLSETPLISLECVDVQGCLSLKEFSLSSEKIIELDLRVTAIETLSPSIGRCSKLSHLYLPDSLKNLPNELSNLRSLRILRVRNNRVLDIGNLHIILDGLQSLKELNFSGCCNLSHFPKNLGTLTSLEMLTLDGSSVESLPASITNFSQLRTLSLRDCRRLRHLPELPPSIEELQAKNCENLHRVDLSISHLPKLVCLNLSYCLKLESLLSETHLMSLQHLHVYGCSSLKEFSLSSEKIIQLDLSKTVIETLSPSIGRCSKLSCLSLPDSLKNLPNELSNLRSLRILRVRNNRVLDIGNLHIILDGLQSLKELNFRGCCNLSHFPNNLGSLTNLERLTLDGSSVESLPASITNLSQLRTLFLRDCRRLRHLLELPPSIEELQANNCENLHRVDLSISHLPKLVFLNLSYCLKLESLLSETHLMSLQHLCVYRCSSLKEFSLSSEEIIQLDLRETIIETLSPSIGRCSKLRFLFLPDSLKNLPNELSNLRSLRILRVRNNRELDIGNLHNILDGLQSLKELNFSGCCNLSHFPNNLGSFTSLETLTLDGTGVESLPASITNFSQLRTLSLRDCRRLRHLPELPPSIQLLMATNCASLETACPLTESEVRFRICRMDFINCVKLDQDSACTFSDFTIKRGRASKCSSFCWFEACFSGNKIPWCFLYKAKQRSITIEFRSCLYLSGFAFCIIISPHMMPPDPKEITISCECRFENGETVKFKCLHYRQPEMFYLDIAGMTSDHLYIWYQNYPFIGNRIEEKANNHSTNLNQKVFIEFSFDVTNGSMNMNLDRMIKECGVQPLLKYHKFSSKEKEQSLDFNSDIKAKRCWDMDDQCRKKFKAF